MNSHDFAPSGRLRGAINFGNPVLARRGDDGAPAGVTVDLAAALARSLGVGLELVPFERALDVAAAAEQDAWDVCFLAIDPARSRVIAFTEPYVRISGCYLVRTGVAAQSSEDVVTNSLRVGVVRGSAYTLFLSRKAGAEHLVTLPSFDHALEAFDTAEVDALAGIEPVMAREAAARAGSRVLHPPFMEIRQAMGIPAPRRGLLPGLQAWLSDLLASGELSDMLERHGLSGECAISAKAR